MMPAMTSFPTDGVAVVIGASGGLGSALVAAVQQSGSFRSVVGFSRSHPDPERRIDLLDEARLSHSAATAANAGTVRLVINATGLLHNDQCSPEKSWKDLSPDRLAASFAVNTIGPALLMKHFLPLLPRTGKALFATLSARVGSIGDNQLGGWYGYRASKAAANQIVRTAAIELYRRAPQAVCVALHPGTVDTRLSAPFRKQGLTLFSPDQAASHLCRVIDQLQGADSGGFFDWKGERIPW